MYKKLITTLALLLLGAPMVANALPIKYDVAYNATLGASGSGSFFYDADIGIMTDFVWDIDGVSGGLLDWHFSVAPIAGDTFGRFWFELLTRTEAHAGVSCVIGSCSTSSGIDLGTGPSGTFFVDYIGGVGAPTMYRFRHNGSSVPLYAGDIKVTRSLSLSEPGTLALFAFALFSLNLVRLRRKFFDRR